MKINVLGTGYVGLVSGVCLAAKGHSVSCFDTNAETINILKSGRCHFYEKDLEKLFADFEHNLSFELLSENNLEEIPKCDAILIAVGTPTVDNKIDLSQIENAAKMIAIQLKKHNQFVSIIVKSTVVPGTTDTYVKEIIEKYSEKKLGQFGLGMNPEFLREGNAVEDFMFPDRIVFGYEDDKTLSVLEEMYSPWDVDKISVNSRSAEMIKYVNNSLLATQISTVNEYSNIAKSLGKINFNKVIEAVHLDKRWNPIDKFGKRTNPKIIDYLKPGCGFGGSCFPKDVMALAAISKENGIAPIILDSVISVNNNQPKVIIDFLVKNVGPLKNKKIIILGLAFKPETDDVRESVSLKLINELFQLGSIITAHDPMSIENARKNISQKIKYSNSWEQDILASDIIIIATNWDIYKKIKNYDNDLIGVTLYDTRSLFKKEDFTKINYLNIN